MAVQILHDDIDADMAFHAFRDYACLPSSALFGYTG